VLLAVVVLLQARIRLSILLALVRFPLVKKVFAKTLPNAQATTKEYPDIAQVRFISLQN
jgi:hypothetical protein